jgi:tetratricopeptide (TPR) repeat protein
MTAARVLNDSRAAAAGGQLAAALEDARTAESLQPYAATPHLQRALILEQAGAIDQATAAARAAAAAEPTNWRTWIVLARLQARRERYPEALAAFERAKRLNPRSNLFARR